MLITHLYLLLLSIFLFLLLLCFLDLSAPNAATAEHAKNKQENSETYKQNTKESHESCSSKRAFFNRASTCVFQGDDWIAFIRSINGQYFGTSLLGVCFITKYLCCELICLAGCGCAILFWIPDQFNSSDHIVRVFYCRDRLWGWFTTRQYFEPSW